jgi:hypothetical protein
MAGVFTCPITGRHCGCDVNGDGECEYDTLEERIAAAEAAGDAEFELTEEELELLLSHPGARRFTIPLWPTSPSDADGVEEDDDGRALSRT